MKNIFSSILLLIAFCSSAQLIEGLPTDENGKLFYSEVVKVDSAGKNELYFRSRVFFANYVMSAKDAIQMDDKDAGVIIVKDFQEKNRGGQLLYTIRIQSKEGRYKYEIYDISISVKIGHDIVIHPAENEFAQNSYYQNGKPNLDFELDRIDMEAKISGIVASIKAAMKKRITGPKNKKEDW